MAAVINSKVQVGIVVKIQRSDGMVHEANITAVSYDHSKIKVEWLENSLVKGKEIDFDTLVLLNPELSEDILPLPSKPVMMTRANSRRTITAQKINQPSEIPRPSRLRASAMLQPLKEADAEVSNSIVSTRRTTISTAKKTKESEKSKKQDRRTQLQEIREKRAQEFDTSNPNWEFMKMIKEFRATLDYRPLSVSDPIDVHKICVCVRKRPLSKLETSKKEVDVVTLPTKNVVLVHEPKLKVDLTKYLENQSFRIDYAFDENVNNEDVYRLSAAPLVQTIFERGMATCFAYGQTGSGKTHWVDDGMHNILFYWKSVQLRNVLSNITMGGNFSGKGQDFSKGIYALATQDVFLLLEQPRYKDLNLTVFVTFFEIYSGKVFDLLNKKVNLRILEDNKQQVQIVGLQEQEVFSVADVILMIEVGNSQRTSGQTSVNNNSSRSHAVFQIILRGHKKLHGQFSLIDLAGNERGADTSSANRQTRMEGAEINKSLLALKECIRALGHNNIYTPFRASKLTLVLRDSFIGENSRTCMIAMISPGLNSCEHTLNTLRYSDRVKELGVQEGASCEPEIPNTSKDINENETMEQSDIQLLYQKNPGETEVLSENQEMVATYDRFALDVPQEEPTLICDMHLDVSRVLELEEQILDEHRTIQQKLFQWINADDELLKMTQLPGYNIEMYTDLLQTNINERLMTYQEFNKNLIAFRQALQKEEQAAQTIQ